MRAQAILHRETLHVHGLLTLTISLLRTRLAILSPSFLDYITSPHLQVQIRGLDSAICQTTQAIHTGLHYIQELLTTFGMIHALTYDTAQLDAELRGRTTCPDPRLPPTSPSTFWLLFDSTNDTYQFRSRCTTFPSTSDIYITVYTWYCGYYFEPHSFRCRDSSHYDSLSLSISPSFKSEEYITLPSLHRFAHRRMSHHTFLLFCL